MVYKQILLLVFCFVIALIDFKKYIIPDFLLILLSGIFIVLDLFNDPKIILNRLIVAVIVLLLLLLVYKIMGGLGFGDVKYFTVLAYCYGFPMICFVGLIACAAGILFFLIKAYVFKNKLEKIPFAPFICFACTLVFILGFIFPEYFIL